MSTLAWDTHSHTHMRTQEHRHRHTDIGGAVAELDLARVNISSGCCPGCSFQLPSHLPLLPACHTAIAYQPTTAAYWPTATACLLLLPNGLLLLRVCCCCLLLLPAATAYWPTATVCLLLLPTGLLLLPACCYCLMAPPALRACCYCLLAYCYCVQVSCGRNHTAMVVESEINYADLT